PGASGETRSSKEEWRFGQRRVSTTARFRPNGGVCGPPATAAWLPAWTTITSGGRDRCSPADGEASGASPAWAAHCSVGRNGTSRATTSETASKSKLQAVKIRQKSARFAALLQNGEGRNRTGDTTIFSRFRPRRR